MNDYNENPKRNSRQEAIDNHKSSLTDPLWTVNDVAEYLRLEPETVRAMARMGKLPAIKVGRVWRFRKSTLEIFFHPSNL